MEHAVVLEHFEALGFCTHDSQSLLLAWFFVDKRGQATNIQNTLLL